MHRLLVVLLAVLSVARPVFADDVTNTESGVKQRLADASASITRLDGQVAALETSIAETQQRSDREREQLRILARVLYAQPAGDNLLMTVLSANSVSDAFTRMGDLASAAQQASRTRGALNRDLANLSAQRAQLVSDRQHQVKVQAQLQEEFNRLVEREAQRVEQARLAALKAATPTPAAALAATPAPAPARAPAPAPAPVPAPAPPPGAGEEASSRSSWTPSRRSGRARSSGRCAWPSASPATTPTPSTGAPALQGSSSSCPRPGAPRARRTSPSSTRSPTRRPPQSSTSAPAPTSGPVSSSTSGSTSSRKDRVDEGGTR